jgi:hypothetical protein
MTSCPEKSKPGPGKETADLQERSGVTEAVLGRQEIRMGTADVDAVGSLEDRHMDQRLNIRRRRQPRKWVQESVGFRQKLAAARMRKICRAVSAVRRSVAEAKQQDCKLPLPLSCREHRYFCHLVIHLPGNSRSSSSGWRTIWLQAAYLECRQPR